MALRLKHPVFVRFPGCISVPQFTLPVLLIQSRLGVEGLVCRVARAARAQPENTMLSIITFPPLTHLAKPNHSYFL